MCSSTSLRQHAPWQLAILHSFACVSLQAALHEPSFRDFRLTLRGLAATTSLLSTIHVTDSCSRVRMWRRRLVQVHGRQFSIRTLVQAFHIPHSTYLLFSAAYSDVQEKRQQRQHLRFGNNFTLDVHPVLANVDKMQDFAITSNYNPFSPFLVNWHYIGFTITTTSTTTSWFR